MVVGKQKSTQSRCTSVGFVFTEGDWGEAVDYCETESDGIIEVKSGGELTFSGRTTGKLVIAKVVSEAIAKLIKKTRATF
jgi:hypothetical protein